MYDRIFAPPGAPHWPPINQKAPPHVWRNLFLFCQCQPVYLGVAHKGGGTIQHQHIGNAFLLHQLASGSQIIPQVHRHDLFVIGCKGRQGIGMAVPSAPAGGGHFSDPPVMVTVGQFPPKNTSYISFCWSFLYHNSWHDRRYRRSRSRRHRLSGGTALRYRSPRFYPAPCCTASRGSPHTALRCNPPVAGIESPHGRAVALVAQQSACRFPVVVGAVIKKFCSLCRLGKVRSQVHQLVIKYQLHLVKYRILIKRVA